MTTTDPTPGRDNPPDLEGCTENHCHGRRRDGTGKACHRPAGWGTEHVSIGACKLHGGNTPSHRTAAREEQARRDVATFGLPVDVEPAQALMDELHRTAGHVVWLGARIAALEEDELVWGVVEEIDRPPGPQSVGGVETKRKAVPHALVTLYQQERKHLKDVAVAALGADAGGRIAAVFEQVGGVFIQAFAAVLDQLDIPAGERDRIPVLMTAQLAALTRGDPR